VRTFHQFQVRKRAAQAPVIRFYGIYGDCDSL
jgi:hypothetical protein